MSNVNCKMLASIACEVEVCYYQTVNAKTKKSKIINY